MFQTRILIFYAGQYTISDSRQSGCTIEYFFAGDDDDNLAPLQTVYKRPGDESLGMRRAKASLAFSAMDKITAVPSLYMGTFNMKVGADGKPVQVLTDIAPIEGTYVCNFVKRMTEDELLAVSNAQSSALEPDAPDPASVSSASSSKKK